MSNNSQSTLITLPCKEVLQLLKTANSSSGAVIEDSRKLLSTAMSVADTDTRLEFMRQINSVMSNNGVVLEVISSVTDHVKSDVDKQLRKAKFVAGICTVAKILLVVALVLFMSVLITTCHPLQRLGV